MEKPPAAGRNEPLHVAPLPTDPDVPQEVTRAPLEIYSDLALAGRLAHYEREGLVERDRVKRLAWQGEAARTQLEIERRRAIQAAPAAKLFA